MILIIFEILNLQDRNGEADYCDGADLVFSYFITNLAYLLSFEF